MLIARTPVRPHTPAISVYYEAFPDYSRKRECSHVHMSPCMVVKISFHYQLHRRKT